ncbi:hypothetical protein BOX15_Mlig027854g4, partial [Macrostomum lignano]
LRTDMTSISVVPLGAGQDVGRSCILVSIAGRRIMFDCGMHAGFQDDRRFPDFTYITKQGSPNDYLDAVIVSHFHLDHCGALPYFTEMVGFDGPVYMTYPTKAICPILLEDYRKVTMERKASGEQINFFTSEMINKCMAKVRPVSLHEEVHVDADLVIKPYYAGHVLGAAMFLVRVGDAQSVLYTGDYNMTPDRHLGPAWVDRCRPSLLITESTYATTVRDSKRSRERDFCEKVQRCVEQGGKVLIPVFALGRAQELCILLETYWERMNLKVPIYFSTGLAERANHYYKLFIAWTNEKIKQTFVDRNMFDYKHIRPLHDKSVIDNPGPMVVFATPGMLHAGQSLQIFKKWAPDERNMVVIPGYCVAGTVGYKIINGAKKIELGKQSLDVRMAVEYLSFSAHADARGIMQLVRMCQPRAVMLVHGESAKMDFLRQRIQQELQLPVLKPANGESVAIETEQVMVVEAPVGLLHRRDWSEPARLRAGLLLPPSESALPAKRPRLLARDAALKEAGLAEHSLRFTTSLSLWSPHSQLSDLVTKVHAVCARAVGDRLAQLQDGNTISVLDRVTVLVKPLPPVGRQQRDNFQLLVSYSFENEDLGSRLFSLLKQEAKIEQSL